MNIDARQFKRLHEAGKIVFLPREEGQLTIPFQYNKYDPDEGTIIPITDELPAQADLEELLQRQQDDLDCTRHCIEVFNK